MQIGFRAALAAAAAGCLIAQAAAAQVPVTQPAPAPDAQPQTAAAPAAPAPAAPAEAAPAEAATPAPTTPATPPVPAPGSGPSAATADSQVVVGYVRHTKAPVLIDSTPAKASFALVGAAAMIAAGHQIVVDNDIKDPSGDMAREIAAAYAAAHGGKLAEEAIPDEHQLMRAKAEKLSGQAAGARYIVDVDSPGMNLIYFPMDWTHFDLMFSDSVRIIDTSNNQIVAKARCFIRTKKTPETLGHDQLLADKAAGLKALIASKSHECVAKLEADLKLAVDAGDGAAPQAAKTSN